MNGYSTKYLFYDSNKQSLVTIPRGIARSLNWNHGEEIKVIFEVKDGRKGLFLYKPSDSDEVRTESPSHADHEVRDSRELNEREHLIFEVLGTQEKAGLTAQQVKASLDATKDSSASTAARFTLKEVREVLDLLAEERALIRHESPDGTVRYFLNLF